MLTHGYTYRQNIHTDKHGQTDIDNTSIEKTHRQSHTNRRRDRQTDRQARTDRHIVTHRAYTLHRHIIYSQTTQ